MVNDKGFSDDEDFFEEGFDNPSERAQRIDEELARVNEELARISDSDYAPVEAVPSYEADPDKSVSDIELNEILAPKVKSKPLPKTPEQEAAELKKKEAAEKEKAKAEKERLRVEAKEKKKKESEEKKKAKAEEKSKAKAEKERLKKEAEEKKIAEEKAKEEKRLKEEKTEKKAKETAKAKEEKEKADAEKKKDEEERGELEEKRKVEETERVEKKKEEAERVDMEMMEAQATDEAEKKEEAEEMAKEKEERDTKKKFEDNEKRRVQAEIDEKERQQKEVVEEKEKTKKEEKKLEADVKAKEVERVVLDKKEITDLKKLEEKSKAPRELEEIKREVAKIVVGQEKIVDSVLRALLSNGHVLIEGVPGIAKTVLIRTIAYVVGCEFSRIQFTVDLLPADITGLTTYTPGKGFETIKGPVFTNFLIADEINRAPPKTQSALLEAMQEKQVTIGRETFKLSPPFFVMANNNPLESSGTYKLPEAQMDRFLFKLKMSYPTMEDEEFIIDQNITLRKFEDYDLKKVLSAKKVIALQKKTLEITASPQIRKYIVRLIDCTRNPKKYGIEHGKYIEYGGSPRASIALQIAAKADAVLMGENAVTPQNVKNVAHDVLRHRILLNYEGQAENIDSDKIIDEILSKVEVP